ncbi:hypothetical protein [Chondromyces crocatus]|uniref:PA domain-containing protein n=1 Tax=Chondromyces crocatus TaxID=52 RepID=A0A0K1ELQ0_CHOCO|nr:hypothetical protein [Chondromyces crocatus]AKT41794.1 uncharacterized protein CMC5_060050 [Chondromyces crocatus]
MYAGPVRRFASSLRALAALTLTAVASTAACGSTTVQPPPVIDDTAVPPISVLERWLDDRASLDGGFMPTGSPSHRAYVDRLEAWLHTTCAVDIQREPFSFLDWKASKVSLELTGPETPIPIDVLRATPHSGSTPAQGVHADLVILPPPTVSVTSVRLDGKPFAEGLDAHDVAGKLAVVRLPVPVLPLGLLRGSFYHVVDRGESLPSHAPRMPLAVLTSITEIAFALRDAGAAGLVAVLPSEDPYVVDQFGPITPDELGIPSVYVSPSAGAAIEETVAWGGIRGHLRLVATGATGTMDNLVARIPAEGRERLVALSTHTDGTNLLEEDGAVGIQAAVTHFCSLPPAERPADLHVLLHGGHFPGNVSLRQHVDTLPSDVRERIVSAVEVEHLGARELLPDEQGRYATTGRPELFLVTTTEPTVAPIEAAVTFAERLDRVILSARSTLPIGSGTEWQEVAPLVQLIAGPNYLLSVEKDAGPIRELIDVDLLRTQAIGLVGLVSHLALAPQDDYTRRSERAP